MSSHMSRKYARNYRKRKSEESSHQKEFKKPKKSSAEQMRELRQHRKENEKTAQSNNVGGPSGVQRPPTVQTSTDHVQTSLEGNTENSDNIEINGNVTAPDEYVLRSPNIVVLSTSGINARASMAGATVDCDVIEQPTRDPQMDNRWRTARAHFAKTFSANEFGYACSVCDRLWFQRDLKKVKAKHRTVLEEAFPDDTISEFVTCSNCTKSLDSGRLPILSRSNGFLYPPRPNNLPPLDTVTTRLISPRLPFMQLRRLRHEGALGIVGQVINVPIDVDETVRQLPRHLDDDYSINVNIKKRLTHKSSYLSGVVRKGVVKKWLQYLIKTPLYRHYNITINWTALKELNEQAPANNDAPLETLNNVVESECLLARQRTLLWNEDMCLNIAPGQHSVPLNIIYDVHAEELSFPSIYYGVARSFKPNVPVTPYKIANSEVRRRDRRGVTPDHILYMAMKILRLRVTQGIYSSFKSVSNTENVTRRMIEDKQYLESCIERNLAFLKTIPNSVQYWSNRKKDLFAMLRQLGKPTVFLTMSANEIRWPKLLEILNRLNPKHDGDNPAVAAVADVFAGMSRSTRCELVNEDPVTCCIYFHKLVGVVMQLLQTTVASRNPFGRYRVLDHFLRIEFQHRGSPHAHILLWLENDPHESISENMPLTVQLVTDLFSVAKEDMSEPNNYTLQTHRHTFTCTKRGETSCRFNIPYWPMDTTRVLLPMASSDGRRSALQTRAKKLRQKLETQVYDSLGQFLIDNKLNMRAYLDIIRASLRRPTLIFKRDMTQIMTNTFNPFISDVLVSNMDIQFILEEYSCAAYVVEYVNKSARGISDLHRQLLQLTEDRPELSEQELLKSVCLKLLNSVEMSSQEAAWYLLNQHMSESSREVVYIPTVWPHERHKSRKRRAQLDREGIDQDSTDVWTKNIIQKYEERPEHMESLCLIDFVAKYTPKKRRTRRSEDDDDEAADVDCENALEAEFDDATEYMQRARSRVVRSRCYDIEDMHNYKRELVTLYVPFRIESVDVLDRDRYLETYEQREKEIMEKRREYEANIDIDKLMNELRELCTFENEEAELPTEERNDLVQLMDVNDNTDDIDVLEPLHGLSVVGRRTGVLSKQEYCERMRLTNDAQRELLLEVIHRLHVTQDRQPIQIFFTGPAGSGKTYVLRLLMETYNRFTQHHNSMRNAYVVCASTGKAAVNLGGITVHSAFKIAAMSNNQPDKPMAHEVEQVYRGMFNGVRSIIIDEVSMISSSIFHKIDNRLKQITGVHDMSFGGLDIILCGDLRQLPPVCATPIFKSSRNTIGGPCLWQSLEFFGLDQVMRQADIVFSGILTKIGDGVRLTAEERAVIEGRFRTAEWCDANLTGVVRLFHRNSSVDAFNSQAIQTDIESTAVDVYSGYRNTTELSNARLAMHKMNTTASGGMPYVLRLGVGHPYMITINLNVEDGLVNGAIGILRYIEQDLSEGTSVQRDDSAAQQGIGRLWFEFDNKNIGRLARLKAKPYVQSRLDVLQLCWTPIEKRTANISIGRGKPKCKRTQFPVSPACALTIHKSQGATFDQVVVEYDSKQETQLVYVALSRVTSIEGLYLLNKRGDHRFYHGLKEDGSQISREIRQEYTRLDRHRLPTITLQLRKFLGASPSNNCEVSDARVRIIVAAHNCQSLVAHSTDIATDQIMRHSDYLALSETWMDDKCNAVPILGFEFLVGDSTSVNQRGGGKRSAGGVAIYRNAESVTDSPIVHRCARSALALGVRLIEPHVGDICMINVTLGGELKFLLASIYVHPGTRIQDIQMLTLSSLARYSVSIHNIIPTLEDLTHVPLILTGDFNINADSDKTVLNDFMLAQFGMMPVTIPAPTTLGNTNIDMTFTRHLNSIQCEVYVCYFSYHRPLLHAINL